MGFAKLFKKKRVPEELPSLAIDEAMDKAGKEKTFSEEIKEKKYSSLPSSKEISFSSKEESESKEKYKRTHGPNEDEGGYFKELIENLTAETKNLDKLDSWYKNKFLPEDIVFQMREYWEKQKPELLLKNIGSDLKNRLLEKTDRLHHLEKEWQEIYLELLSKEEEIRKEEKELKKSISEFINLVKGISGRKKEK